MARRQPERTKAAAALLQMETGESERQWSYLASRGGAGTTPQSQ